MFQEIYSNFDIWDFAARIFLATGNHLELKINSVN